MIAIYFPNYIHILTCLHITKFHFNGIFPSTIAFYPADNSMHPLLMYYFCYTSNCYGNKHVFTFKYIQEKLQCYEDNTLTQPESYLNLA